MQKFIINQDGVLRFGNVYLHRDLLSPGETAAYGGGLWKVDNRRGAILLFGRSFDFGPADFGHLVAVDWATIGIPESPLFFLPHWPDESQLIPVITH